MTQITKNSDNWFDVLKMKRKQEKIWNKYKFFFLKNATVKGDEILGVLATLFKEQILGLNKVENLGFNGGTKKKKLMILRNCGRSVSSLMVFISMSLV